MKAALVRRVWGAGGVRLLAGDVLVISLLASAVVAASLPRTAGGEPRRAEVVVTGRRALTVDLRSDALHDVTGPLGVTRIEVRGRRVRVFSSPCPRQVCRHGGWIGKPGEMLVCLPNEILIRVPGENLGAPDATTR